MLYRDPAAAYPRKKELPGRFVGVVENTGDVLMFYVLSTDHMKNQIIARGVVRPVTDNPLATTGQPMCLAGSKRKPAITQCLNEPPELTPLNEHV